MKITIDAVGDVVQYRVHDVDERYRPVLEACFLWRTDAGYAKRYPGSERHIDKITRRYARYVPEPIDCGPYARAHLETVTWRGHTIRVPPLSLQIAVNRKRCRWDRVGHMEAHLRSR